MSTNVLEFPKKTSVDNYLSGRIYNLVSASEIENSKNNAEQITEICNQPTIYNYLFLPILEGKAYPLEKAEDFINWAQEGWAKQSHFVFLLISEAGSIVGCLDIKSNDLNCAEIGYWCSERHPGLMTNSVKALCEMAETVGFKKLRADVLKGNTKSTNVLIRAGFQFLEVESSQHKTHNLYYKTLKDSLD